MIDAKILYNFNACIVFYTHRGDIRVWWLMPRDCIVLVSTFVFCCTRIEATSGFDDWCRDIVYIQRLHCVLHASSRHQGSTIDAERLYKFNVCFVLYTHRSDIRVRWLMQRLYHINAHVVFYTHRGNIRVRWLMPRDCIHSTLYCVLHASRRHQGSTIDAEKLYKVNVCIALHKHRGEIRVRWLMPREIV